MRFRMRTKPGGVASTRRLRLRRGIAVMIVTVACSHQATLPPAPASAIAADQAANVAVVEQGRHWTALLYAGRTQELWDHCDDMLRYKFKRKEEVDEYHAALERQLGAETALLRERVYRVSGVTAYL